MALTGLLLGTLLSFVPAPAMARVPAASLTREHPVFAERPSPGELARRTLGRPSRPATTAATATDVEPFGLLGVAMPAAPAGEVLARVHRADGWSEWHDLHVHLDSGPDEAASDSVTTEPWWVGVADGYEVRVPPGLAPVEVLLVREDRHRWVATDTTEPADATPDKPPINRRSAWAARPLRGEIVVADDLKVGFVHHTVSTNSYGPAEVPSMLRSIQVYHQDGNGWTDIGYNFLVDRFGRTWEGHDGGMDLPVVGGHAKGFNTGSVGVAVLGDFTSTPPTNAAVDAVGRVIGWKLTIHGIDPRTRVDFATFGNERYAPGTVVNLPRVLGHRDTGMTSCPGALLYSRLGDIRAVATSVYLVGSDPFGHVDAVVPNGPRRLKLAGWVADPDAPRPTDVHVYVDGVGVANVPADGTRPDVLSAYPWIRQEHKVDIALPELGLGAHEVCAYAINQGQGGTVLLGCTRAATPTGAPFGRLDPLTPLGPETYAITGYALDPDTGDPLDVHVYVDGVGLVNTPASLERSDVGRTYAGWGPEHGFSAVATLSSGAEVCAYAIDEVAPGGTTLLGCVEAKAASGSPFGVLDGFTHTAPGSVQLSGWAIDPDTTEPIEVHVYDQTGPTPIPLVGTVAAAARSDLASIYPGWGGAHGLDAVVALPAGDRRVCAYAIDRTGPGSTTAMGCIVVPMPAGSPVGELEVVAGGPRRVRVAGWTVDPDVTAPTNVHVYVDGIGRANVVANGAHPGVQRQWRGWGPNHGFDLEIGALEPGPHDVCVFAIDANGVDHRLVECRTVAVPTGAPFGAIDVVEGVGGTVRVAGWGVDPDTDTPTPVHVYVDGVGRANVTADMARPDLRRALPGLTEAHGYDVAIGSVSPGTHAVCTFLIDVEGSHPNTLLRCDELTVAA